MEVEVAAPDTLDLESLRGCGPQQGETLQPEDEVGAGGGGAAAAATAPAAAEQPDEEIVAALMSMGFSANGSKRAGALLTAVCERFLAAFFSYRSQLPTLALH